MSNISKHPMFIAFKNKATTIGKKAEEESSVVEKEASDSCPKCNKQPCECKKSVCKKCGKDPCECEKEEKDSDKDEKDD